MDCSKINLKKGSKGNDVKEVQNYLKYVGYYNREVDGDYGTYTEEAVKKLQKAYSCKVDGIFGKETCSKCGINGQDISNSIQTIKLSVFEDMRARFDKYNKEHKKEATICYLDFNNKYRYVTNTKMKDMIKRFDAWVKEHNNNKPNFVYVNFPTNTTSMDGSRASYFKQKVGSFTDPRSLYNRLLGRGYIGYNNDVYDFKTAVDRIAAKKGINCSDACQVMYEILTEMGYDCRYVHIMCKSGIGHIQLDVKTPKGVSTYTRIDPAAALSTGSMYAFGKLWCASPKYLIGYNPGWLMKDDGVT